MIGLNADPACRRAWVARLKLLSPEIAPSDDGVDVTRLGAHGHEAALEIAGGLARPGNLRDPRLDRPLRFALQLRVVGRVDAQAAAQHPVGPEQLKQLAPHFLLEIQAVGARPPRSPRRSRSCVIRPARGWPSPPVSRQPRCAPASSSAPARGSAVWWRAPATRTAHRPTASGPARRAGPRRRG